MALNFLNYLWKVIKLWFWNTDEGKRSGGKIPPETLNDYGRTGDSESGRKSDCPFFGRECESGDFFVRSINEIKREYAPNHLTRNVDHNHSRYFKTGDKDAYRYMNDGVLDAKCGFGGDAKRFEDRFLCKDCRYFSNKRVFRTGRNVKVEIRTIPQKHRDCGIVDKPLHISSNLLKRHENIRNLLLSFYERLLNNLSKSLSFSDYDVKRAMEKLMFNYKNLRRCETPQTLDFNDMATCIGYLHRYAICHAVMVYNAFIKLISSSTSFLSVFSKKKLNMMCLGSGPGNDFIGFIFALKNSRIKISNIDVTVVDRCHGWYTIFSETIEMFNRWTRNAYEKPSKTFIQADLSKFSSWNFYMKKKLNDADIVTLVKVMSNISEENHPHILRNVVRLMKDDSFLIIIDCPLPSGELSALHHFLYPVFSSGKEKFNFKEKKTRFGYPNISQCTAYIRVYKKRNSSQFS